MNDLEKAGHSSNERNENRNEQKGLSTGWKAVGALSWGVLLGGKWHKIWGLGSSGLSEEEMKEMKAKGGWLASVAKKTVEVYSGIEKMEEIADEHDFRVECKKQESLISEVESEEERQRMKEKLRQMVQDRNDRLESERLRKETFGKMFEVVKGIAGW